MLFSEVNCGIFKTQREQIGYAIVTDRLCKSTRHYRLTRCNTAPQTSCLPAGQGHNKGANVPLSNSPKWSLYKSQITSVSLEHRQNAAHQTLPNKTVTPKIHKYKENDACRSILWISHYHRSWRHCPHFWLCWVNCPQQHAGTQHPAVWKPLKGTWKQEEE